MRKKAIRNGQHGAFIIETFEVKKVTWEQLQCLTLLSILLVRHRSSSDVMDLLVDNGFICKLGMISKSR